MSQASVQPERGGPSGADAQPAWAAIPAGLFLFILPFNHTMALRLFSLAVALGVALWSARKWGMPPVRIKWPLLLWLGLALLSVTWSAMPLVSLGEIKVEIGYGMAAFFAFFILTRTERDLSLWLNLIALSVAVTLALGFYRYLMVLPDRYRWEELHGYASYSTYLAVIAPLLVLWMIEAGRRLRVAGWALMAACLYMCYLLANRMFWISLAAVLAVFAIGFARNMPRDRFGRRAIAALLAGIAVSGALFMVNVQQRPADPAVDSAPAGSAGEHLVSTFKDSERRYIWAFWLDRIAEKPWTGVGFGRDLPHWVYEEPPGWRGMYFAHAHNLVLDYALQMGIPGAAVLLVLFGAIALEFLRHARLPGRQDWLIGVAGVGLVIATFSKNMTDDLFWRTDALAFWACAGILLGCAGRLRENAAPKPEPAARGDAQ